MGGYDGAGRVTGALLGILPAKSLFRRLPKRRLGGGEALVMVSVLAALLLAAALRGWNVAGNGPPRPGSTAPVLGGEGAGADGGDPPLHTP